MAGRIIRPSPALFEIFKSWQGGAIRIEKGTSRMDVILDRPDKNNCLSGAMMRQFGEHAQVFSNDDIALIVFSGAGKSFCSGADLGLIKDSKMGIVPSWGGAEYLEGIMGRGKALAAMGRANVMGAEEARRVGYVDYVYETEEEAESFINQIGSSGLHVTRAQKAMLNAVKKNSMEAQKKVLEDVWNGETHRSALQKQLEAVVKK